MSLVIKLPKKRTESGLAYHVAGSGPYLLLIHGVVDDVVVLHHNMSFIKTCVDKGVQVDYFSYPGHPHNVRGIDRVHLMRKVLDYVDTKLND